LFFVILCFFNSVDNQFTILPKSILKIALDVPLDRLFDYLSDEAVTRAGQRVQIGHRVLVPFGRRSQIGIVVGMADTSDFPIEKLKPVTQVFTDELPIDSETLGLIKFSADYYQYPFGQALLSALPARLRQIAPAVSRKQYAYGLTDLGRTIDIEQISKRQLVVRRILEALQAHDLLTETDLDEISSSARKIVKQLVTDGWAISRQVQASIKTLEMPPAIEPQLNDEQMLAARYASL
jgi:primosomal protein N' (replication factor Y)